MNSVVYSFHVREKSILNNKSFNQMLYSATTIRKFNKNIKINVFVSPPEILNENLSRFDYLNINFIPFLNTEKEHGDNWPETFIKLKYTEFLLHRWKNALDYLENNEYKKILFLDTDTIFHKDPDLLFNKYFNSKYICAKPDNSDEIINVLKIKNGINDGQVIIDKNILLFKKEILNHINVYINYILNEYKNKFEDYGQYLNLHWVSVQYAIYDYFKKNSLDIDYFENKHVMISNAPLYENTSELILHHYFSGNSPLFLPEEFRLQYE